MSPRLGNDAASTPHGCPPGACCCVLTSSPQTPSDHLQNCAPGACWGVLSSSCWKIWLSPLTASAAVYLQATPFSRYSTAWVRLQAESRQSEGHAWLVAWRTKAAGKRRMERSVRGTAQPTVDKCANSNAAAMAPSTQPRASHSLAVQQGEPDVEIRLAEALWVSLLHNTLVEKAYIGMAACPGGPQLASSQPFGMLQLGGPCSRRCRPTCTLPFRPDPSHPPVPAGNAPPPSPSFGSAAR